MYGSWVHCILLAFLWLYISSRYPDMHVHLIRLLYILLVFLWLYISSMYPDMHDHLIIVLYILLVFLLLYIYPLYIQMHVHLIIVHYILLVFLWLYILYVSRYACPPACCDTVMKKGIARSKNFFYKNKQRQEKEKYHCKYKIIYLLKCRAWPLFLHGCRWWTMNVWMMKWRRGFVKNVRNIMVTEEKKCWDTDSCRCHQLTHLTHKKKTREAQEQRRWKWEIDYLLGKIG